MNGMLLSPSS